jgi:hypothetical protein
MKVKKFGRRIASIEEQIEAADRVLLKNFEKNFEVALIAPTIAT